MHFNTPFCRLRQTRGLMPFALLTFLVSCPADLFAQRAEIASPGSSGGGEFGQTTRFDSTFNPAISLVFDVIGDWREFSGGSPDGLELNLNRLDLLLAAWIDPNAFAWATIAYEEEELELDEAAIEYVGLPGNHTLRAGRFFADFGKQMQSHVEELRTIERPLVLRDYLGEELAGEGLQWDHWTSVGDATLLRYSVGVFNDISGGGHGHGEEDGTEPEIHVDDRKSGEQLGFTGRLTALTEIGDAGTLQMGLSGRWLTDFAFEEESSALALSGLSNAVYGVDLSYGWVADDGISNWTMGGEYLMFDGDLSAELDNNGTATSVDDRLVLFDDQVSGAYVFLDHGWSRFDSAGMQYSMIQEPEAGRGHASEFDLYYTRQLSETMRLRFGATLVDNEDGEDSGRFAIQLTGFIGSHGHGLNW
jgi:hypothetical protein